MTAPTARIASSADVARRLQPVVVGGDILAYSYVRELHRAYGIERTIVLATQDIKMLSSSRFTDYRLEPLIHDPEDLYDALERVVEVFRVVDERFQTVVGEAARRQHLDILRGQHDGALDAIGAVQLAHVAVGQDVAAHDDRLQAAGDVGGRGDAGGWCGHVRRNLLRVGVCAALSHTREHLQVAA